MPNPLLTYLQDHLAGARFAISLLNDLRTQSLNTDVAHLATQLQPEIESDRLILEDFAEQFGQDSNALKEAAAWVAQKAGRFKLDLSDPIGVFETIEMLTLGVLGKLALWTTLKYVCASTDRSSKLDLDALIERARIQHRQLESMRVRLAETLFVAECR